MFWLFTLIVSVTSIVMTDIFTPSNAAIHRQITITTNLKPYCYAVCLCMQGREYIHAMIYMLKHTTTLFSLSDHYILSREWRVIVDKVHHD